MREQLDQIVADFASFQKSAGLTVYLMEELGDARLRCEELVRYVAEATKLIEKSTHRDHFFEVAGHLIQGVPEALFKLQKALQAVSLAASRMDYEELKQELRPEKVDELEQVLKDIRIRHVQRRSDPIRPWEQNMIDDLWKTPEARSAKIAAAEPWKATELKEMQDLLKARGYDPKDAKKLQNDGMGPYELEHRLKTKPGEMGSLEFTHNLKKKASGDEKESRFEEGKPADPTENMSPEDARKWKEEHAKNKDNFKEASVPVDRLKGAVESIERACKDIKHHLGKGEKTPMGDVLTLFNDIRGTSSTMVRRLDKNASGEDPKLAAELPMDVAGDFQAASIALKNSARGTNVKKNTCVAVHLIASAIGKLKEDRSSEALFRAYDIMHASGMWDLKEPLETRLASDDDKRSRFEEGKPADPTENMSPEDAKRWKEEHAKNKDNFKSAAAASPQEQRLPAESRVAKRETHLEGKPGYTMCGERASDTIVESVKDSTCFYCKQQWERTHKSAAGESEREFKELNKLAQGIAHNLDTLRDDCKKLVTEMDKTEGWYAPDMSAAEVEKLGKTAADYRKKMFGWGGISFVKKKEACGPMAYGYDPTAQQQQMGCDPTAAERDALYGQIKPGCGVTIVTPHGQQVTGMAIAPGPAGWILNVKGRPGIAHPENVVKVAGNDEKESRFEEGKPADPTENMSPEDAEKWKEEHAKNKDNFKAAGSSEFWKPVMDEDPKKIAVVWVRPGNQRDGEAHAFKEATFDDGSTVVNNVSLCGKKFQGMSISKARAHGNTSSGKCPECEKKQSRSAALAWKDNFKAAARIVPLHEAKKGDMVEVEVGTPWPGRSSQKEKVTGKVVRVLKDGGLMVDVEKTRDNPGGHSNEDVGYVEVAPPKKSAAEALIWKAPEIIHTAAKVEWAEKGGKWVARVSYAGGEKHEWAISKSGSGFSIVVKTPKGSFKRKKGFDSLEQAQRFANRFIDRADGHEMLEESLGKDFQEV